MFEQEKAVELGSGSIAVYLLFEVIIYDTLGNIKQNSQGHPMSERIKKIQKILNATGFSELNCGKVDGIAGRKTIAAIKAFQSKKGLVADGIVGQRTLAALYGNESQKSKSSNKWPTYKNLTKFYGNVGDNQTRIQLPYPMILAWDKNVTVKSTFCHEKVADSMVKILTQTLEHYGIAKIKRLGLDVFGGCLNVRRMRGGTQYSTHSWGISFDLDPEKNQLRWKKNKASFAHPDYDAFWGFVEGAGATSLGRERNYDWMHFQFCDL